MAFLSRRSSLPSRLPSNVYGPTVRGETSPPIQLHCEAALRATFSPDQICLRAQTVYHSAARMPAVAFAGSYGVRWSIDIVTLPHNGLRRQLADAYTMANALAKMATDVSPTDLGLVYDWLETLARLLHACFEAEEDFLYPLVRQAAREVGSPCPQSLCYPWRNEAKRHISLLLHAALETRDASESETRARIIALRYALDRFGEALLAYFSLKEDFIPNLFRLGFRHGAKEKEKFERTFFTFLLHRPQGGMLAALILQCIESKDLRADFVKRNVRKSKERKLFQHHISTVESRHMRLPLTFHHVATRYERMFDVIAFTNASAANPNTARGLDL